jgi:hypothetical protein
MKNEKIAAVVEKAVNDIKAACAENDGDYGIILVAAIPGDGERVNRHTIVVGNGATLASAMTLSMVDTEALEAVSTMALKALPLAKRMKPIFDALNK